MQKWKYKFEDNIILITNTVSRTRLFVNDVLQDTVRGLTLNAELKGKLSDQRELIVTLGGTIDSGCKLYVDGIRVFPDELYVEKNNKSNDDEEVGPGKWVYNYESYEIAVSNKGKTELIINDKVVDSKSGLRLTADLFATLPTGEKIEATVTGFFGIKCELYIDGKLMTPMYIAYQ